MNKIILSRGVHQMVTSYLKKDKLLTDFNKKKLSQELKSAQILPAKQIPEDVVTINTVVKINDIEADQQITIELVRPEDAKNKNNKRSVLSSIGLALLGYNEGTEFHWEMPDGLKRYRIEKVSPLG